MDGDAAILAARERLAARFANAVSLCAYALIFRRPLSPKRPRGPCTAGVSIEFSLASSCCWFWVACHAIGTVVRVSCDGRCCYCMQGAQVGGKGTVRRKHKAAHKAAGADDKKLQATLKRLGVNPLPAIEEVCCSFTLVFPGVVQLFRPHVSSLCRCKCSL